MYLNLLDLPHAGVRLDRGLDLEPLAADDGESPMAKGVRLRCAAVPGPRGVALRAELEASVHLRCSRCLERFVQPLAAEFELLLVPEAADGGPPGEREMHADDADLFHVGGDKVDLREIAVEQIHLNLPLKPVCRADCRGLCPACGANRNEIECACRSEESDPRLTPLRELRDRMGGDH